MKKKDPNMEEEQIPQEVALAAVAATLTDGEKGATDEDKALRMEILHGLSDFVNRQKVREEEAKAQVERHYENSRLRLEETNRQAREEQDNCSHMKQGGRDYCVGGQRLSNGQLFLLCQRCQKTWFYPLLPEQKGVADEIPHEIWVRLNPDMIGSATGN